MKLSKINKIIFMFSSGVSFLSAATIDYDRNLFESTRRDIRVVPFNPKVNKKERSSTPIPPFVRSGHLGGSSAQSIPVPREVHTRSLAILTMASTKPLFPDSTVEGKSDQELLDLDVRFCEKNLEGLPEREFLLSDYLAFVLSRIHSVSEKIKKIEEESNHLLSEISSEEESDVDQRALVNHQYQETLKALKELDLKKKKWEYKLSSIEYSLSKVRERIEALKNGLKGSQKFIATHQSVILEYINDMHDYYAPIRENLQFQSALQGTKRLKITLSENSARQSIIGEFEKTMPRTILPPQNSQALQEMSSDKRNTPEKPKKKAKPMTHSAGFSESERDRLKRELYSAY